MDFTPEHLTAVALRLPAPDRARIAEALLDSLAGVDADLDAEWLAEAERRDRALVTDSSRGRPASAVFAEARVRLAAGEFEADAPAGV